MCNGTDGQRGSSSVYASSTCLFESAMGPLDIIMNLEKRWLLVCAENSCPPTMVAHPGLHLDILQNFQATSCAH